ncbi:UNVERIFIED_CONTAM: hypothetical protein Slati_1769400 [Sesamum latifolium]|uniref:Uncharacterized protein n=1 Tax=Sesamum latifolium TaxID=2727402 RepID=A0AAW2X2E0_9LAMI
MDNCRNSCARKRLRAWAPIKSVNMLREMLQSITDPAKKDFHKSLVFEKPEDSNPLWKGVIRMISGAPWEETPIEKGRLRSEE